MAYTSNLELRLRELERECASLRSENAHLRALLGLSMPESLGTTAPPAAPSPQSTVTGKSAAHEKIALFRSLFRGRADVFAKRWESNTGKSGYSPACRNEWVAGVCSKPCSKCTNCDYSPLTDEVIRDHLSGKATVGLYPLLTDETSWFLAVDFDKTSWMADVRAFLETCEELGVPAYLERSRSGNGGHVWIFFDRPITAAQARRLGSAILTRTMDRRHEVGLDSYDRLFPNQDTMPKGGFGNLIALPLQKAPRDQGNSVFVDREFNPHPDQWAFLAEVRRMRESEVDALVEQAALTDSVLGVRMSETEEDAEADPWTLPPSGARVERPIAGPFAPAVRVVQGNLIYVEKDGLPPAMLNRIIRLAAFQNPEFYQAQKMRMSTYGKPRIIGCAEDFPNYVGLPRGCLGELLNMLTQHDIKVNLVDERNSGNPIDVRFCGSLTPWQQQAAQALLAHEMGILSATTAFGKTVVGSWLIAERRVNTLVLVHRRQLLDQWRERLATFLGVPKKAIGQIGGGRDKPTGIVDVGVIQSLSHKGVVKDIVAHYGQVIVDECHHLSAFSFELLLKQAKARYVVGLTATPVRKDGHHPIIMMQCGPIRFRVDAKEQAATRPFDHVVITRKTEFHLPAESAELSIQDVYAALGADEARTRLIVADTLQAVVAQRSPLILTERTQHAEQLAAFLSARVENVILLRGGMGAKQRRAVSERLASIPEGAPRVIIATGRYIGEGFDDARLDTLFLAMPVSWRGTLQQYAGRLHRLHDQKHVVQVYDYLDAEVPMLARMYEKRLKGYKALGYTVDDDVTARGARRRGYQPKLWTNSFLG